MGGEDNWIQINRSFSIIHACQFEISDATTFIRLAIRFLLKMIDLMVVAYLFHWGSLFYESTNRTSPEEKSRVE